MEEIVIIGAARTPIGSFGGALANVSAAELGAIVIKEALHRANVAPEQASQVIMGCVLQAGLGQNVARQAALKAGVPAAVPSMTVNMVCGSGLKAVTLAAQALALGEADIVVCGGMENMSLAPYLIPKARYGYRMGDGKLVDAMIKDGLWCAFHDYHMGITAENVARQWGISREEQDAFAASSQNKAEIAQQTGRFKEEIVPVPLQTKKGVEEFKVDEFPRPGVTVETLAKLRPAFKNDGTVTAGNASGINDGAAALVVTTAGKAKELGLKPLCRYVAGGEAGVDPAVMGVGPVEAVQKALKKAGWTVGSLDLIEANEAFAAQSLAVAKSLDFNMDLVNVNGGAIALGHPIGASGARILVTLLYEMHKRNARKGLATLCVGGGQGVAVLVERD